MNRLRVTLAGLFVAVAGCAVPGDPYESARAAAAAGRVVEARTLLAGPAAESQQPRVRRLRAEVERRVDDGRQQVLRGIDLLCEERHDLALALFENALRLCPDDPYAASLLETTRARLRTAAEATPAPAPLVEGISLDRDARASALREIELMLQEGLGDRALSRLDQLHASNPQDAEVARQLARVLNQQALLRYGQGKLTQSITYWKRVLELQPDAEDARRYLQLAEREQGLH